MITFGLRIDHRIAPGDSSDIAKAVGRAFDHPAFRALRRVAYSSRDRRSRYQPRTATAVAETLLSDECDAAFLDSGRTGELIATANILTGRDIRRYASETDLLPSHAVVPSDPAHPLDVVEGFAALVSVLDAVCGYICVERGFSEANAAAIGFKPKPRPRDFPRRTQERKAHNRYFEWRETQIAGPEWGLFLGPGHLARVTPDPAVFPIIQDVGRGKLCLLSDNPEDALGAAFDGRLEEARRVLGPVLMDVSGVPVD